MKIILLFLMALFIGCGTPTWVNIKSPTREYITYNIDSICNADTIPTDLTKWKATHFRNYEDRKPFTQYLYVKDSIIYIRTDSTIIKRL